MKRKPQDHEAEMGAPPKAEDNYNSEQTRAAKKAGAVVAMDAFRRAVMDTDPDFRTLHEVVNDPKLVEDEDLRASPGGERRAPQAAAFGSRQNVGGR